MAVSAPIMLAIVNRAEKPPVDAATSNSTSDTPSMIQVSVENWGPRRRGCADKGLIRPHNHD